MKREWGFDIKCLRSFWWTFTPYLKRNCLISVHQIIFFQLILCKEQCEQQNLRTNGLRIFSGLGVCIFAVINFIQTLSMILVFTPLGLYHEPWPFPEWGSLQTDCRHSSVSYSLWHWPFASSTDPIQRGSDSAAVSNPGLAPSWLSGPHLSQAAVKVWWFLLYPK